jgi:arylsulfatase A-like enzyme
VGQLRAAVKESGREEDTILVFTSDHGDMLQCQGLPLKQFPWEESIRVPFLVRYPRKLGQRRREAQTPIDAVDIFPTLAGLAGLKAPEAGQGQDLSPVMTGRRKEDANAAALLNLPVSFSVVRRHGLGEYRGIRDSRHTFVRSMQGAWLLYDNVTDPFQMNNLAGKPESRDLQARMERRLDAKLKAAGDDFLPGARYAESAGVTHYREVNAPVGDMTSPWGDWRATWKR